MAPPWARRAGHIAEFGHHLGHGAWVFVAHNRSERLGRNVWDVWRWEPGGCAGPGSDQAMMIFEARTARAARLLAELWESTYGAGDRG